MAFSPVLSHVVLVISAAVLFYAALTDFKYFKIPNELILILAGLFIVHALLSGRWRNAYWNVGFAAFMFAVMLYFYSQKLMGGGDVKMLAVAFLWVGLDCAFVFALLMAMFAIAHSIAAKLGWVTVQQASERKRIPLAPSVAGALIVCFMLGCLRPLRPTEPSTLPSIQLLPWVQGRSGSNVDGHLPSLGFFAHRRRPAGHQERQSARADYA